MPIFRTLILLSISWVTVFAFAQSLTFEAYYPNRVEATLVYDYSSNSTGLAKWSYRGTMTKIPSASELINGQEFQVVIQKTHDLPDHFPKEWKAYYRETSDGLYIGQLSSDGRLDETLEFPIAANPDEPWKSKSSFWLQELPELLPIVDTALGKLENCLQVTRTKDIDIPKSTLRDVSVYCPGIGLVHSIIENIAPKTESTPEFRSTTEIKLIEVKN